MAASKVYRAIETPIVFADSAQTPDENLTLTGLAAGAARISARHDFGVSGSRMFKWRATFQMATAGVVSEEIEVWISTSDGTNPDGEEGTADAALGSTDSLLNMDLLGSVKVDTTSINVDMTSSGFFTLDARYASIVVFNNTADALRTSTAVHSVTITPVPDESQ